MSENSQWWLYILRCGDNSLYTGITTNVQNRLRAHSSGKGAKYTRGRQPLQLVYEEACGTHSEALQREIQIKAMNKTQKENLILHYGMVKSKDKS